MKPITSTLSNRSKHASYTVIVIGAGLTGSAGGSALVESNLRGGPDRTARAAHSRHSPGVFGSHYDESRIVRTLDCDVHWGLLARRSIARFADLQRKSGIPFYRESGHLALAERSTDPENYVNQVDRVARQLGVACEVCEDGDLHHRFPFLKVPQGTTGRYQGRIGGFISPRSLVRAQIEMATRRGAEIIPETAVKVRADREGVRVETQEGKVYLADRVIVATGAFCNFPGLLPVPLDLTFMGRTVLFLEPDSSGISQLRNMPSIIDRSGPPGRRSYILPPCRYPDDYVYLKIGSSVDVENPLENVAEVADWYRSNGNPKITKLLREIVRERFPAIRFLSEKVETCVNYYSANRLPYLGKVPGESSIIVIAGGNGGTAKSSDEYGHIAARLLFDEQWNYDLPEELFAPKAMPLFGIGEER